MPCNAPADRCSEKSATAPADPQPHVRRNARRIVHLRPRALLAVDAGRRALRCRSRTARAVAVNILERLAMRDSVPGRDLVDPTVLTETSVRRRGARAIPAVLERLAIPYKVDKRGTGNAKRAAAGGHQRGNGSDHHDSRFRALRRRARPDLLLNDETLQLRGRTPSILSDDVYPRVSDGSCKATAASRSSGILA